MSTFFHPAFPDRLYAAADRAAAARRRTERALGDGPGRVVASWRQFGRCDHCICDEKDCDRIGCGEHCRTQGCQSCIGGCPDEGQDPGCRGVRRARS